MPSAASTVAGTRRRNQAAEDEGRAKDGRRGGTRAQPRNSLEQRILLTATLCLLAFGIVMVYSASSASGVLEGGSGGGYLIKFALYGGVGLLVMRFLARGGVARMQGIVGPLLAASFVLVLAVHMPGLGVSVNGAKRWIGRGPLVFQPSELLKLALVLYAATIIARRPRQVRDLKALVKPLLLVVGAALLLVASQPDIGTAMVISFTIVAMLVAAGIPLRSLAILIGTVLGFVIVFALAVPYARARLTSFIDPWAHRYNSGFQAVQGQIAIGSGGLFGVGPGRSVQKIFYLPEAPTDFILAVIGEELGVIGVCALLSLYGMIAYAGLRAAKAARSLHSALIAVGLTSLIVSEAVLNVFAVLGLAPLTGVPLPFVSYGASNLVVMLASMGLLMDVASGGSAHVRAVRSRAAPDARRRERARLGDERNERTADRDRDRRHSGARGAGARGGR
ncbi:MAG TPA: putative lipid II flippase FtsW [Solirubrobacteraceae bacterium]|jgi:cell division protein FtsW